MLWKEPRPLSVDKWINKLWYVQASSHYSALIWKEPSGHEKTGRNFDCIFPSEGSQPEKATYCTAPTMWHAQKGESLTTVKQPVVAGSRGGGAGGADGARRSSRAADTLRVRLQWWRHVITLLPTPAEWMARRVSPREDDGPWGTAMGDAGSRFLTNAPLWGAGGGALIRGEAVHVRSDGVYTKSLYRLNVTGNLKLLQKNKVAFSKKDVAGYVGCCCFNVKRNYSQAPASQTIQLQIPQLANSQRDAASVLWWMDNLQRLQQKEETEALRINRVSVQRRQSVRSTHQLHLLLYGPHLLARTVQTNRTMRGRMWDVSKASRMSPHSMLIRTPRGKCWDRCHLINDRVEAAEGCPRSHRQETARRTRKRKESQSRGPDSSLRTQCQYYGLMPTKKSYM